LPVGETGGASGGAGFAGTQLQDPKGPKLGGSRSAARPGRSPKSRDRGSGRQQDLKPDVLFLVKVRGLFPCWTKAGRWS